MTLTGTVTGKSGVYFVVQTDGPPHLATMDLVPRQMAGATVGDTVTLNYRVTPTSGLWYVTAVHAK